MVCKLYEGRIQELEDYVGGQLTGSVPDELASHLERCELCRAEVEQARECGALLRSALVPAGEPGAAFWQRVRAGIRAAAGRQGDFWGSLERLSRRLAWSAALAVALLIAYGAVTDFREPPGTPAQQAEVGEIFPEGNQPPVNQEEFLLTLVGNNR